LQRILVSLATVFAASLILSAPLFASRETTGPGSRLEIYVFISNQKLSLAVYSLSDYAGNNEVYIESLQGIVRGDTALFIVRNKTKQSQDFSLLGKKTPPIKPGGEARFTVVLAHRGAFPYSSGPNGQKRLKGSLVVY
jgi:hypothetical protein